MLTVDETNTDYFVDTNHIPIEKADALAVKCFPIKFYKSIEVGNEEEGKIKIDVYSAFNKMNRIGDS